MLTGHQVLDRSEQALITRRSGEAQITRRLHVTAHTRTQFIIARKTWSLRFVCAAMMAAPLMARRCQPTRRNAADCTATLKSRLTEQFIFPITAVVARAQSWFRKTTA